MEWDQLGDTKEDNKKIQEMFVSYNLEIVLHCDKRAVEDGIPELTDVCGTVMMVYLACNSVYYGATTCQGWTKEATVAVLRYVNHVIEDHPDYISYIHECKQIPHLTHLFDQIDTAMRNIKDSE